MDWVVAVLVATRADHKSPSHTHTSPSPRRPTAETESATREHQQAQSETVYECRSGGEEGVSVGAGGLCQCGRTCEHT